MAVSYVSFSAILFILASDGVTFTEALNGGFTVELIHRDSPKSPFYNSRETPFRRVTKALHRSINRVNGFFPSSAVSLNWAESDVTAGMIEYYMSYFIGTPPFEILGVVDTGSDLIWSQCKPCPKCYNQTEPLFDPAKSSTYKNFPCSSQQCWSLPQTLCFSDGCHYIYQYVDKSFTLGNLASETIQLVSTTGRSVPFPETIVGCGHENNGSFESKGSGIVGLGGGPLSLITQMGSAVGGKFAYCLLPQFSDSNATSKLSFGEKALVSGLGTVSTPLIKKDSETFYYLTLNGFSVGTTRLNFEVNQTSVKVNEKGNIVIDSGTTFTFLPAYFYYKLESEVKVHIKLEQVDDPTGHFSLCHRSSSGTIDNAPIITAHFDGGDVELKPVNTFIAVSEEVVCLAFFATSYGAVLGNVAQINFLVGYDIQNKVLSIKPTDCTKH